MLVSSQSILVVSTGGFRLLVGVKCCSAVESYQKRPLTFVVADWMIVDFCDLGTAQVSKFDRREAASLLRQLFGLPDLACVW